METFKNEFELKDYLKNKRSDIKNFDELVEFLHYVKDNCNTGYGEAPRSIAQACLAVAWFLSDEFGITGFQAGFVTWDFIREWSYTNNKTGLKIVNYDDMLYPQYSDKFDKTIKGYVWEAMQNEALNKLENTEYAHPNVKAHWRNIVDGVVPFGYKVVD